MELVLERGLKHQQDAINAINAVFNYVPFSKSLKNYQNPKVQLSSETLAENIKQQQQSVITEHRGNNHIDQFLNLDIKMETGTGKTYVYTKAIYELNHNYGLNKFIIIVPTLPIKAGTKQFIEDRYSKKHFADEYGKEIELLTLEAVKNKKKGKSFFPNAVDEFIRGGNNSRKIYVLLLNSQLLTNGKMLSADYDYAVEGFFSPLKAIASTNPVVIIDEPHRFTKGQKAFSDICSKIKPQIIIRFGATFPDITVGSGRNKRSIKDYHNLIYELDACDAFNNNLIKGVDKEHLNPLSNKEEKIKILNTEKGVSATFKYIKGNKINRSEHLGIGDSLSMITEDLEGIYITAIKENSVEFSNGIEKNTGEEIDVDAYMSSYQEQMIKLALERHFETERRNFCDRQVKIKTLALFFIDDISSYRITEGKRAYLREIFEKHLKNQLEKEIAGCNEHQEEYRQYLQYSLEHIDKCHSGYFAQDNNDSDENVANEIKSILYNKKELLAINGEDGSYNINRFLFSKWTLKEGWDNPNVFTIAKLRSSGSENSKLQEVGRGLRLPVDENGNRVSNEEFYLNYIVDFTEKDFANKLVEQINKDRPSILVITEEMLKAYASSKNTDVNSVFIEMLTRGFIDINRNVNSDKRNEFVEAYPELFSGLKEGKVKDSNKQKSKNIKIRSGKYNEIRALWEALTQNYMITYNKNIDDILLDGIVEILANDNIFEQQVITSKRDILKIGENGAEVISGSGKTFSVEYPIKYGEFLERINRRTNIPISVMHNAMVKYHKAYFPVQNNLISEYAVNKFVQAFNNWKLKNLQGRFNYKRCATNNKLTPLTNIDGSPKEFISQASIGTKVLEGNVSEKYLYDTIAYDSPLEKENIVSGDIEEIIVYGKIPRKSIAIPVIAGGTYSPDFMYVVKKANGDKELNIIVETKDVDNNEALRGEEKIKIDCAKKFFEQLKVDGYNVSFHTQIKNIQIKNIINSVLANS